LVDDILEKENINQAWLVGTLLEKGPLDILDTMGINQFNERYTKWTSNSYISSENLTKIKVFLKSYK